MDDMARHGAAQVWMACFPMLLVITAEFDSWMSTKAKRPLSL